MDEITVHYPNMFALLDDLALMGEGLAIAKAPRFLSRDVLFAASAIYQGKEGSYIIINQKEETISLSLSLILC